MKTNRLLLYVLLCFVLAGVLAAQSASPDLTFTCKVPKVKGAAEVDAYAINNAGLITGDYVDSTGNQHGMILNKKKATTFEAPSGGSGIAGYGIDTAGDVVGWYVDSNGIAQGFLLSGGNMTSIFYPKSASTQVNGMNDNGYIVGDYIDNSGITHGFYFDGKKYKKLDVKGATTTIVWSVNNSNVFGLYTLDSSGAPQDGYTYTIKPKKFTKVDVPGAAGTVTHGINNNGDINFTIFDSSNNRHGVLYQASTGVFTQFDVPDGTNSTRADGINDTDAQVGRYSPSSGNPANQGFLCTVK